MKNTPIHYYQIDYPGATTTRRYLHTDELGRPIEAWSFPTSGDTQRVWAINPDLYGWDDVLVGEAIYQPLSFPGQQVDVETIAWEDHSDPARPALHANWHRTYDPFSGAYLQTDPSLHQTWSAYGYANNEPVRLVDPTGKLPRDWGDGGEENCAIDIIANVQVCVSSGSGGGGGGVRKSYKYLVFPACVRWAVGGPGKPSHDRTCDALLCTRTLCDSQCNRPSSIGAWGRIQCVVGRAVHGMCWGTTGHRQDLSNAIARVCSFAGTPGRFKLLENAAQSTGVISEQHDVEVPPMLPEVWSLEEQQP